MKKILALAAVMMLLASCFPGSMAAAEEKQINIVTTIFPIYDWVREVVGPDAEHVSVTLLLDNGVDLHSYQPSARDIGAISSADLFIYVGGESDEWVEDVLATAVNPGLKSISLVDAMGSDIRMEEITEGMEHGHEEEEEEDEHVWLSLRNAQKLTAVIAETLCEIDPAHAEQYRENAAAYGARLAGLDARYTDMVNAAAFRTILFGDRFPFRYLADDYGLSYYAAFTGCSAESEASFETVIFLARKVDELGLPAVLTMEHPRTRIAETVVENTSAGNQKILEMDSMQGTTAQDIAAGTTYLSVMESNLEVLAQALN